MHQHHQTSDGSLQPIMETLRSILESTMAQAYSEPLVQEIMSFFPNIMACNANQQTLAFMELEGPKLIVQAMERFPNAAGVQYYASIALRRLVCEKHWPPNARIANAGVMLRDGVLRQILRNLAGAGEFQKNNIRHITYDLVRPIVMDSSYFCQHLEELTALVEAIVKSMEHSICASTADKAISVLMNLATDESDPRLTAVRQQIIKAKGANAIVNAMKDFPNNLHVQIDGTGALCHMSFGTEPARSIRRLGAIGLVCKAMDTFPYEEIMQESSCNFIWAMSNFCPNAEYTDLIELFRSNSILEHLKNGMARNHDNTTIHTQAVSALGSMAKKSKVFRIDMSRAGILDMVGKALGRFAGRDGFATVLCFESIELVEKLIKSDDEQRDEIRFALCSSDIIPNFLSLSGFINRVCWSSASVPGVSPLTLFTLGERVSNLLRSLGAQDISMFGDDEYDFDDDVDEERDFPLESPPFDVNSILDQDLLESPPGWYKGMAFRIEYDRSDLLNKAVEGTSFLYPTVTPEVGQEVCLRVSLPYGGRGYLYGAISSVGPTPTDDELSSDSNLVGKGKSNEELRLKMGANHGQEVTAIVSLSSPHFERKIRFEPLPEFFLGENTRYKAVLRWSDNKPGWLLKELSKLN